MNITEFIQNIPKCELHLHIEGTLEPELMFKLAERNKIKLKYKSVDEVRDAYQFTDLQSFLDIYYGGTDVLLYEQDFYDLTFAYLQKVAQQNVRHAEIFFDPQTHAQRGIEFATVINGIHNALEDGKKQLGISSYLIMSFLRDLSADDAMEILEQSLPFKNWIKTVGLDSAEQNNPPSKFTEVFAKAREHGFLTVAHAGEEGPVPYIWEALDLLKVSRIDHGNTCLDDSVLVERLSKEQMPLTMCPLSNLKLKGITDMKQHPVKTLLEKNIYATINSDDPAYFGGYINENFIAVQQAFDFTKQDIKQLAQNSIVATFLPQDEKDVLLNELEEFTELHS